jgi:hypothetical protein
LLLVRPLFPGPSSFDKFVAIAVSFTMILAPVPRAVASSRRATGVYGTQAVRADSTAAPRGVPVIPNPYFLRDAVPSAGFAVEPEDTTDDAFLPEEKSTKQLVWEITAWVVGAAIVAYFIIKVFIEEDTDEDDDDDGGTKPPPPG